MAEIKNAEKLKPVRLAKLPVILSASYLILSLFVYFGTLGHPSHSWWPIILVPLTLPISLVIYLDTMRFFNIWYGHPAQLPDSAYAMNDYLIEILMDFAITEFIGRK